MLDLFDCKVKLAGSNDNEVRREKVTAAEIIVLRDIHGEDSVVEIVGRDPVAADSPEARTESKERDKLAQMYGADRVANLFGATHNRLPDVVPGLGEVKRRVERVGKNALKEMAA